MDGETCPNTGEVYQPGKRTIPHFAWMVRIDGARSCASRQLDVTFPLGPFPARVLSNIRPFRGATSGNRQSLLFQLSYRAWTKGKTHVNTIHIWWLRIKRFFLCSSGSP